MAGLPAAESPRARLRIYERLRRWMEGTPPQIVRCFWPPGGAPSCAGCGVTLRAQREGATLVSLPPGPARDALRAGDPAALSPDLPIEPGEVWYAVCAACLTARAEFPGRLESAVRRRIAAALSRSN